MWAAQALEYLILVLLIGLSIYSLSIIFDRRGALSRAISRESFDRLQSLIQGRQWAEAQKFTSERSDLGARTYQEVQAHSGREAAEHAIRALLTEQRTELERGLSVLATLGANAPFIGLFGTVVGIIRAFAALSTDQAGSAGVMAGISAALIATAAGLAVAIPAVIAFNVFQRKLDVAMSLCEALKDRILAQRAHGSVS